MAKSSRSVTQADVAKAAGVSQGVVSRTLSGVKNGGSMNVGDSTRANVLRIAQEMGYQVRTARQPRDGSGGRRSNVLFVRDSYVVHSDETLEVYDSYRTVYYNCVNSLSLLLQQRELGLELHFLSDRKELMQRVAESEFSGIIWEAPIRDLALLQWLESRCPLVGLNSIEDHLLHSDSVCVRQHINIRMAAEYLWQQGHRKIATFGHVQGEFKSRLVAYKEFVQDRGIRDYVEFQALSDDKAISPAEKVAAIIETWKSLGEDAPTAMILGDVFAIPLLLRAPLSGIEIPRDLSVVGIDNTSAARLTCPPLTSMEESFDALCHAAIELLTDRMQDPSRPPHHVSISPRLIERESVRRLSGGSQPENNSIKSLLHV